MYKINKMYNINKTTIEKLDKIFPNALFYVAIDLEELDTIVTEKTDIIVKHVYNCFCYDDCKKNTDYFYISCTLDKKMTNKFIIQELIKQGLNLQECNHHFLEGFIKSKESDCDFEIIVSS